MEEAGLPAPVRPQDSAYVRRHHACRLTLFTLAPDAEATDSLGPHYQRSMLHLVANSLGRLREGPQLLAGLTQDLLPSDGRARHQPRQLHLASAAAPQAHAATANWVVAPTTEAVPRHLRSGASSHRGFATDPATWAATCARILNVRNTAAGRNSLSNRLDF